MCGSPCGRGFQCNSAGTCEVAPGSAWIITVTTGTVAARTGTGGVWDIGSAPDPFVCVTFNGRANCTPDANDTFAPSWNYALPPVAAGMLLAGVPTVFRDRDLGGSEAICADIPLTFTQATFVAGEGWRECGSGRWSFMLRPQ